MRELGDEAKDARETRRETADVPDGRQLDTRRDSLETYERPDERQLMYQTEDNWILGETA